MMAECMHTSATVVGNVLKRFALPFIECVRRDVDELIPMPSKRQSAVCLDPFVASSEGQDVGAISSIATLSLRSSKRRMSSSKRLVFLSSSMKWYWPTVLVVSVNLQGNKVFQVFTNQAAVEDLS